MTLQCWTTTMVVFGVSLGLFSLLRSLCPEHLGLAESVFLA